jgi:hypothetical protein
VYEGGSANGYSLEAAHYSLSAVICRALPAALAFCRREPLPVLHSLYDTSRPAGGALRSILVVDAARSVNGF